MGFPLRISIDRGFFPADLQNFSFSLFQPFDRSFFGRFDPITKEIIRIIGILGQITPGSSVKFSSIGGENIEPRIFSSEKTVARHHGGQCSKGESIPAKSSGDELTRI